MQISRALFAIGLSLAVTASALALPPGLTQSGNVVMMQPVDSDTDARSSGDSVRHASRIHVLSASDHDLYNRAFDLGDRGDWTGARGLAAQGRDAIATRLIEWRYLLDKNSGATFVQIGAFLHANPDWPLQDVLFTRAEAAMDPATPPAAIIAWFDGRTPAIAIGKIRLGEAMIATGKTSTGGEMIRAAWIDGSFDAAQEFAIVQRDGIYLTADSDKRRLSNLLWRDEIGAAKREMARAPKDAQQLAQVRIALRSNPASGQRLASVMPGDLGNDPDLLFDRARTARRGGDNRQAEALLLRAVDRNAGQLYPTKLWAELNLVSRQAIKDGDYRTAYRLLADSGFVAGSEFADAEFMAGWVALRFLKDPQSALKHFRKLAAGVSRPISQARAYYWQGRALEAAGEPAKALQQYQIAARTPATFYGQLALAKIDPTPTLHLPDQPMESVVSRSAFDNDSLTRAIRVLADLGEARLVRLFALRAQELHPDARHVALLAQMLVDAGYRETAVRVAKEESYNNILYLTYCYPVIAVPAYRGPGTPPETALVLGLIRQETEFDSTAVSGPGALGIMQIMPSTARHSAAVAGVSYRPNDLLSDPDYNMQLGMTEVAARLSDWGGSLVLATAAYNAGPGNARKWLAAYGDPRSPAVDPLDWIEMIPFSETRNYVQRVLENIQVYRNRLAGRDQPLQILSDLYRPNAPPAGLQPTRRLRGAAVSD